MNQVIDQKQIPWLEQCLAAINNGHSLDGYVYLLHFTHPIGRKLSPAQRAEYGLPPRKRTIYTPTARHYLGWCSDLAARIQAHSLGHGSSFTKAAHAQGVNFVVARVWPGTRELERRLKNRKNTPRLCPCCRPQQLSLFELTPAQIAEALVPF